MAGMSEGCNLCLSLSLVLSCLITKSAAQGLHYRREMVVGVGVAVSRRMSNSPCRCVMLALESSLKSRARGAGSGTVLPSHCTAVVNYSPGLLPCSLAHRVGTGSAGVGVYVTLPSRGILL